MVLNKLSLFWPVGAERIGPTLLNIFTALLNKFFDVSLVKVMAI